MRQRERGKSNSKGKTTGGEGINKNKDRDNIVWSAQKKNVQVGGGKIAGVSKMLRGMDCQLYMHLLPLYTYHS